MTTSAAVARTVRRPELRAPTAFGSRDDVVAGEWIYRISPAT
jgi:hypothetical protein